MIFLDLETTGPDPLTARIVEIAVVEAEWPAVARAAAALGGAAPGCLAAATGATSVPSNTPSATASPTAAAFTRSWSTRVNPGIPIPAAATAVHGITDAAVAAAPTFAQLATTLLPFIAGKDVGGQNLRRYDLVVLECECMRAGLEWPAIGAVVDTFEVEQWVSPRDLPSLVRKYLAREHAGAHGALADARACADVLVAQLRAHPELPADPAALDRFVQPADVARRIDPTGKLLRRDDGEIELAFSSHKGMTLREVDIGFLRWVIAPGREFHPKVVAECREALRRRVVGSA